MDTSTLFFFFHFMFPLTELKIILNPKYSISMPLIIEKPVSKPIVPPIAASISVNLAELSFVILSKGSASKNILKYFSVTSFSRTKSHKLYRVKKN